jgi:hypothetical protein
MKVAKLKKDGKSIRAIAAMADVGVSIGTIQADLRKAVEMGLDIEPKDGMVVGLDKRRQPASGPRKQSTPGRASTVEGLLDELAVIIADGRKLTSKPTAIEIRGLAARVAATADAIKTLANKLGR